MTTFLLLLLFFALIFIAVTYNRLISKTNLVKEGWSGIDVQLKRRHDLIPSLVEVVKGYAKHEEDVLVTIVQARTKTELTSSINKKGQIENNISQSIANIFALAESYPDLKADSTFLNLQSNLKEVEDHLQYSRRYYNGAVRDYENTRQVFPANLIAVLFKFEQKEYFQLENRTIEEAPTKIKFNND